MASLSGIKWFFVHGSTQRDKAAPFFDYELTNTEHRSLGPKGWNPRPGC